MQREFLQSILDRIAAELPAFKHVDIFNNQLDLLDEGKVDSIRFPALFISFPEGVNYSGLGAGVQKTDEIIIRFYIVKSLIKERSSVASTVLDVMDLKQTVYNKFQDWQTDKTSSFQRVYEEADENRTTYYTFIQDYTTSLKDSDRYINLRGQEVTLGLDLTSEVIINPATKVDGNGIRTAKNVNDG